MECSLLGEAPCHTTDAKSAPLTSQRMYSDNELRRKMTPCGHRCIASGRVLPGAVKKQNCAAGGMALENATHTNTHLLAVEPKVASHARITPHVKD